MNVYPEAVAQIVEDYLVRLKAELATVPSQESSEILSEIESHIYESYQGVQGTNDIARILNVLRKIGTPAEVAGGTLGTALVSAGTQRSLPFYVVSGILIALFGIPLGVGGVAVLLGALGTLIALVLAYYATAGAVLVLAGAFVLISGTVAYYPTLWDRLGDLGLVRLSSPLIHFLESLSPKEEGLLFLILGTICVAIGLGMLRFGRHLMRGLRFTLDLGVSSMLPLSSRLLRKWRASSIPTDSGLTLRSAILTMKKEEA
jgi:uncharacterized membrane protein